MVVLGGLLPKGFVPPACALDDKAVRGVVVRDEVERPRLLVLVLRVLERDEREPEEDRELDGPKVDPPVVPPVVPDRVLLREP